MDYSINARESNAIPKMILTMFFTSLCARGVAAVESQRGAACIAPASRSIASGHFARSLPNTLGRGPCHLSDGLRRFLAVLSR